MATFHPIPFADLIRRVFVEYKRYGKIFGVPEEKFFTGCPGSNLSVTYMGQPASTPFGPAAGPHTQLAQNIVAAWLTGARIIELKTVQLLDDIRIPRPCIDTETIGFNIEWSQELSLEQSLEFCREDECVEVTPEGIRIRKVELDQTLRARAAARARKS